MAALYNSKSWKKKDIVLEMCYTDLNQTYQIWLLEHGSKVIEDSDQFLPYTARVETPLTVWKDIGAGKVDSMNALIDKKYKILGDLSFMSQWEVYFGGANATTKQKRDKIKDKQSSMWVLLCPCMDCTSNTFLLGKFCSNTWQCSYRIILFFSSLNTLRYHKYFCLWHYIRIGIDWCSNFMVDSGSIFALWVIMDCISILTHTMISLVLL